MAKKKTRNLRAQGDKKMVGDKKEEDKKENKKEEIRFENETSSGPIQVFVNSKDDGSFLNPSSPSREGDLQIHPFIEPTKTEEEEGNIPQPHLLGDLPVQNDSTPGDLNSPEQALDLMDKLTLGVVALVKALGEMFKKMYFYFYGMFSKRDEEEREEREGV